MENRFIIKRMIESAVKKSNEILDSCSPLFFALGDETRRKMIIDISLAGNEGITVSDLHKKTRLSRPAVSHHLKVLKDCHLVKTHKIATQIFYSANLTENLEKLSTFIDSVKNLVSTVKGQIDRPAATV